MTEEFRKHIPVCPDCRSAELKPYTDELKLDVPEELRHRTNWQSFECQNCKSTFDVEIWSDGAKVTKRTL